MDWDLISWPGVLVYNIPKGSSSGPNFMSKGATTFMALSVNKGEVPGSPSGVWTWRQREADIIHDGQSVQRRQSVG